MKWHNSLAILVSLASIALVSGCSRKTQVAKPLPELSVGIVTWPGLGPMFIANQKGFFKANGLGVKWSIIEDEAARRSAFAVGQLDVAVNTVDALASGAPGGVNGKVFLETDESYGADGIIAKKSITSIAMLKGKRVAYPKGLPSEYFLYEMLKDNNMTLNDIHSINMGASDAGAAFAAGKIDAAVTWEPWLSQGLSVGKILATTRDKPGLIVDVLMANPSALKEKEKELKAFVQGWFEGLEYMRTHHEESVKIIANALKLSPQDVEGLLPLVKFANLKENRTFLSTGHADNFYSIFSRASVLWLHQRIIDHMADPAMYCDSALVFGIERK